MAQSGRANRLRRRPEVAFGVVRWRGAAWDHAAQCPRATAVVFAKFMCATLSTLRTGCMAQSGRAAGGIAAAKLALSGANPT